MLWLCKSRLSPFSMCLFSIFVETKYWMLKVNLGGERNRYKNFRIRFRQCWYRISGRKKNREFGNLWIDFMEDIFPVYFYSESESNSLKSIQRFTNSPFFFLPDILYRHCRNRIRKFLYLFRSPPIKDLFIACEETNHQLDHRANHQKTSLLILQSPHSWGRNQYLLFFRDWDRNLTT